MAALQMEREEDYWWEVIIVIFGLGAFSVEKTSKKILLAKPLDN